MELMKMTMNEVKEYLKNNHTIIIPIGAIEEHSDALPLGTDSITAEALAKELGARKNRIVAPTIPFGNCHSITYGFTGTISISPINFTNLIIDYLKSLYKHGFRRFIFINGHGGNISPIRCAIDEVANVFQNSRFLIFSWWLSPELSSLYDNSGHAGRGEVSMILYLDESLVKKEYFNEEKRELPVYYVSGDLVKDEITETGIINDTQLGSKELGESLFKKSVEVLENLVDKIES